MPSALQFVAVAEENASVEKRWCKLRDAIQATSPAILSRARRQHQNWLDDNDAVVSNLFAEKNRLNKAYFERPTDNNRTAFYHSRRDSARCGTLGRLARPRPHLSSLWSRTSTRRMGLFDHLRINDSGIYHSLDTPSTSCTSTMTRSTHTPSPNAYYISSSTTDTISETDTPNLSSPHCPLIGLVGTLATPSHRDWRTSAWSINLHLTHLLQLPSLHPRI
nr:unnamed protein product [Spirometra erinaceieuropaei]